MFKKMSVIICVVLLFISCGGLVRTQQNVTPVGVNDIKKSCALLKKDIEQEKENLYEVLKYREDKRSLNWGSVAGSLFFLPMLFALDVGDTDVNNTNNRMNRYNGLIDISESNNCKFKYKKYDADHWDVALDELKEERKKAGKPEKSLLFGDIQKKKDQEPEVKKQQSNVKNKSSKPNTSYTDGIKNQPSLF
jgi:hypothetical protein